MLIAAQKIWLDHQLHADIGLTIEGGVVQNIAPLAGATADRTIALALPYLTDLQVNGGGGTMVNSDPTTEGIMRVVAAHKMLGTGTILPTVITDTHDVIEAASLAALDLTGTPGMGGLHIEGPHIAVERRGTHNPDYIRPLDQKTVDLVCHLRAKGLAVMLTLAPELADADLLAQLVACGTVVSAGHTTATAAQTKTAIANGLGCFTHLFNAMPPMTSRAPGIVGAALNAQVPAGIIVDGLHVSWDMVRIALRARPQSGLTFAVSDAMATVGGPDHFTLYGQDIYVKDGALVNAEGSLAGAHIDLRESLHNLVTHVGLSLSEAIPMVTDIPRRVMNLAPLGLTAGMAATDILALSDDYNILDLT